MPVKKFIKKAAKTFDSPAQINLSKLANFVVGWQGVFNRRAVPEERLRMGIGKLLIRVGKEIKSDRTVLMIQSRLIEILVGDDPWTAVITEAKKQGLLVLDSSRRQRSDRGARVRVGNRTLDGFAFTANMDVWKQQISDMRFSRLAVAEATWKSPTLFLNHSNVAEAAIAIWRCYKDENHLNRKKYCGEQILCLPIHVIARYLANSQDFNRIQAKDILEWLVATRMTLHYGGSESWRRRMKLGGKDYSCVRMRTEKFRNLRLKGGKDTSETRPKIEAPVVKPPVQISIPTAATERKSEEPMMEVSISGLLSSLLTRIANGKWAEVVPYAKRTANMAWAEAGKLGATLTRVKTGEELADIQRNHNQAIRTAEWLDNAAAGFLLEKDVDGFVNAAPEHVRSIIASSALHVESAFSVCVIAMAKAEIVTPDFLMELACALDKAKTTGLKIELKLPGGGSMMIPPTSPNGVSNEIKDRLVEIMKTKAVGRE